MLPKIEPCKRCGGQPIWHVAIEPWSPVKLPFLVCADDKCQEQQLRERAIRIWNSGGVSF